MQGMVKMNGNSKPCATGPRLVTKYYEGGPQIRQEAVSYKVIGPRGHHSGVFFCLGEILHFFLKVRVKAEDGGHISTAVAVVGGRPHSHQRPVFQDSSKLSWRWPELLLQVCM